MCILQNIVAQRNELRKAIDENIADIGTQEEDIMYENLKNLNDLRRTNARGIYKRWIYNSTDDFHLACDYLQKIGYSIQDINSELNNDELGMKEVVYIIALVDWIKDSSIRLIGKIKREIADKYKYSKLSDLELVEEYFVAMRSFILAHPVNTTKHNKFGFNGNFICVDLITKGNATLSLISNEQFFNIDYYGLHRGKNNKHTYYLKSYSNDIDRNKYFKYISFSIEDILNVARVYIDALYELDTYLFKTKKKDIR